MKISFVLTGSGHRPVGGFKVIYEYANRLAADGHIVTLVHPQIASTSKFGLKTLAAFALFWVRKLRSSYLPKKWFQLHPDVKCTWILTPRENNVPEGDFVFATGWNTAKFVADLPKNRGEKFYFLQHYETWAVNDPDIVGKTWTLDLKKIAIAKWLRDIAQEMGEPAHFIPNGLDFHAFGLDCKMQDRDPASVLFLNHWRPYKGTADAIEAVKSIVERYPGTKVRSFGIAKRPDYFPDYIEYFQNPSQSKLRELYNQSAIFIAPSHSEGWGLTASEAMICGCAVVATNVGGHREFMVPNENALVVDPKEAQQLAKAAMQLIEDGDLRLSISENAQQRIAEFTWEKSYAKLLKVLKHPNVYEK